MRRFNIALLLTAFLTGCVQIPIGPTVAVWPAAGKPFDVFMTDDAICRQFANSQIGVNPEQAAGERAVAGAAIGTVLGAATGAAIGAAAGNAGVGAGVGAGTGLLAGTAAGANAGSYAAYTLQRRYNIAYQQCMYAKGNQIPGAAPVAGSLPPPPTRRDVPSVTGRAQWHYCKESGGYYPYVRECPGGWQMVPATPPPLAPPPPPGR